MKNTQLFASDCALNRSRKRNKCTFQIGISSNCWLLFVCSRDGQAVCSVLGGLFSGEDEGGYVCVCVVPSASQLSKITQTEFALQKPLPRQLESAATETTQTVRENYTLSLRMKLLRCLTIDLSNQGVQCAQVPLQKLVTSAKTSYRAYKHEKTPIQITRSSKSRSEGMNERLNCHAKGFKITPLCNVFRESCDCERRSASNDRHASTRNVFLF